MKQTTLEIRRIVEYRDFFVGEDTVDIRATLKRFSRNTLVRMAAVLSLHYGNMCFPDNKNTLFSESSKKQTYRSNCVVRHFLSSSRNW